MVVKEMDKGRPIAIGVALVESKDIPQMKKGKAVSNVHYVGDDYWAMSL
ncbi:MAG: PUA domain-containing protein [Zestosphaera sp.]